MHVQASVSAPEQPREGGGGLASSLRGLLSVAREEDDETRREPRLSGALAGPPGPCRAREGGAGAVGSAGLLWALNPL